MSLGDIGKAVATGGLSLLASGGGGGGSAPTLAGMRNAEKQTETQYQPFIEGGTSAQQQLMAQMGLGGNTPAYDVSQLPGYQDAMKQGLLGVKNEYAGSGLGANQMMALQQKGQNVFGDYYNNYMTRLTGMANNGQNAVGNLGNFRMGAAQGTYNAQENQYQQQQQKQSAMMSDVLGLAGTAGGMMVGGPMGALVGDQLGSSLGSGGGIPFSSNTSGSTFGMNF